MVNLPPKCSQKRILIDESASPTHIRRKDGAERDAIIRVRRRNQFQSPFSDRVPVTGQMEQRDETKEKPTPVACEEQRGPLSQVRLQKDDAFSTNVGTFSLRRVDRLSSWEERPWITERQKDGWTTVLTASPEHTQGENDLINRTNFECSPGSPVPDSLKCFTQALRASTLREKSERETPHNEGTGTEPKKTYAISFPGSIYRSSLYRGTATIGAAADLRVQKRDNITPHDDVEQSLKDLVVRSQPRFREECWSGRNKSGISLVTNARVRSRNDIKAEKGYGPYSENDILFAGLHIYEIMCCDRTNKDNLEEEELGSENTEKARDLGKQVNPYEWVSTVENNGYLHEYGPELTGGKISVDHSSFTTTVSIHGGRKATKTYKSVVLLDSGSPSSFVTQAVIDEMLRKGAASAYMVTVGKPRRWGGFADSTEPLQTNSSACLSVQFFKGKNPTTRMKVPCHIVPPTVLQHGLFLGRDIFFKFQNHTYATLPKEAERPVQGVLSLSQNPEKNMALIQPTNTENDYHLRYVGKHMASLTSHPCMLMVMLVRADNTPAMTGSYFVQMLDGWNLDEDAMVEREGKQSIPLSSHEYSEIPSATLTAIYAPLCRHLTSRLWFGLV